jgi:SAM-dependent methyltransferase
MTGFHDYFSDVAADYARFRPRYPEPLFAHLSGLCASHEAAWDCATGSGQAAVAIATYFQRVVATDLSPAQIAHATPHPRVEYRVAAAEASGLPAASMDLVTVAQALHWLRPTGFFTEVQRVLRPGGLVAVWVYQRMQCDHPAIQRAIEDFYDVIHPHWPPERAMVDDGYSQVPFPFEELASPSWFLEASMTPERLAGYAGTWSATRRCRQALDEDPVPDLLARLRRDWPAPGEALPMRWPLRLRLGRHVPR